MESFNNKFAGARTSVFTYQLLPNQIQIRDCKFCDTSLSMKLWYIELGGTQLKNFTSVAADNPSHRRLTIAKKLTDERFKDSYVSIYFPSRHLNGCYDNIHVYKQRRFLLTFCKMFLDFVECRLGRFTSSFIRRMNANHRLNN